MKTQYLVTKTAALSLALATLAEPALAATINLSACGDITQPGSYLLTRDLTAPPNKNCFTIQASNVTLDLGGHTVIGDDAAVGAPVGVVFRDRTTVKNGTIERFATGIAGLYGAVLTGLTVKDNLGDGILVDGGARIQGNTVTGNGEDGIVADSGALITDNDVQNNGLGGEISNDGILADPGSEIRGNLASFNRGAGIQTSAFDSIGTVSDNDVEENGRNGINVVCPASILNNKVRFNNAIPPLGGKDIRTTETPGGTGVTCSLSGNHQ